MKKHIIYIYKLNNKNMALTREQFDSLRAKGLSVEQIVKFEQGETPMTAPKPSFFGNVGSKLQARGKEFVSEIGKSATGDLASTKLGTIGRGTLRTGSLIGGGLGDIFIEGVKAILPQKTEDKIKEGIADITSRDIPQKVISIKIFRMPLTPINHMAIIN